MIDRPAEWVAAAAGGTLVAGVPDRPGPRRAVVDSRAVEAGDLFVGLPGAHVDGGAFAAQALARGAWGALLAPDHASSLAAGGIGEACVIAADQPLAALAALAREWRRALGARVVGVTGSTGKTSTKDILAAMLGTRLRTHASRENFNTEIGLPLSIVEADPRTEALVLEMAMRGEGQIAELTAIAEPDVGVIVNVGPVHLELLGTVERVAAAKAELIRDLPAGAACVVPAGERLLADHLREDLDTWTFGAGGDVTLFNFDAATGRAAIDARGERFELDLSYREPHNVNNTLAAVAAGCALGVTPPAAIDVRFSSLRGEIVELPGAVTVVNDCYNANPMSMRAALEHLAAAPAERRIAVLGLMAELGDRSADFHREIGEQTARLGVDVLITVGEDALGYREGYADAGEAYPVADPGEAGALLREIARPGDRVLVKGSRSAGLEAVVGNDSEAVPVGAGSPATPPGLPR